MVDRYRIGDAVVERTARSVTTVFPEGRVYACPDGSTEQAATARALGYGVGVDAVDRLNAEHDVWHSILAVARGWQRSAVLHGVATGTECPQHIAADEEAIVMLLARAANVGLAGILNDYTV